MDKSTLNKFQHQYWVTKQTVYRKLGKKEDDCIVSSDACLDAKLELFKSIQQTSAAMNKLLDRYQERICYLAQEQNAMGRFLKEYGKADKSNAGKMMIQMGKSLIYCSQQEISLRPPLLRLYQEVETFRYRAVDDTLDTIKLMERHRTEYRASLNWMKNVSQELDPDTFKQMEKFRKVQTHVKKSKGQFDKLKLACLQKVDLLAAARCNMFSHALIQYQTSTMKTTEKIAQIFNTLAITFKGYQHFEFSVIKELVEPARKAADEAGTKKQLSDQLLFDFENDLGADAKMNLIESEDQLDESLLEIGESSNNDGGKLSNGTSNKAFKKPEQKYTAQDLLSNELLLDNLLGGLLDQSPDTELASEALDLSLAWPSAPIEKKSDLPSTGRGIKKDKEKSAGELLSEEFENIPFEGDNMDTVTLLNELLSASGPNLLPQQPLVSNSSGDALEASSESLLNLNSSKPQSSGFLPSQLLDFGNLLDEQATGDLLNFNNLNSMDKPACKPSTGLPPNAATWYDIFADLDPIANPDAIGKKENQPEQTENRYC